MSKRLLSATVAASIAVGLSLGFALKPYIRVARAVNTPVAQDSIITNFLPADGRQDINVGDPDTLVVDFTADTNFVGLPDSSCTLNVEVLVTDPTGSVTYIDDPSMVITVSNAAPETIQITARYAMQPGTYQLNVAFWDVTPRFYEDGTQVPADNCPPVSLLSMPYVVPAS